MSKITLGIDFGGTTIKSALVSDGHVISRLGTIETGKHYGAESLIEALIALVKETRESATPPSSIGIGLPGLVDSIHGIVHELSNVPGWEEVALVKILSEATGLPVAIENDANCMAYGEWAYGAGRGRNDVVCVVLGTGVGAGLILNGKLHRGAQLGAGEIGQMTINMDGVEARYGNFGALERYVGNRQIAERAMARYRQLGFEKTVDDCEPVNLAHAAKSGDSVALEIWRETGEMIGTIFADVAWLLNPDRFVVGGGIAKAGELLFKPIRDTVAARTLNTISDHLEIIPAALGTDAGLIGAAAVAEAAFSPREMGS